MRLRTADGQARQPVSIFDLLPPEHGSQFFQIVSALGGDLVAHAPDFFQYFVFHRLFLCLGAPLRAQREVC